MPGTVIGKSLNFGFPGTYARTPDQIIHGYPASEEIPFGSPVMLDAATTSEVGAVKKLAAGSAAVDFIGIAVRVVKSALIYPEQNFGAYQIDDPVGVIERGAVSVLTSGTPKVGGKAYYDPTAGKFAAASGAGAIELTNCRWGSAADANGVAELVILTRQGA